MTESERFLDPLSNIDIIDGIDVTTTILDPVVSNTSSCRFNIESRAFLQKDARLSFNLHSEDADEGEVALNSISGGMGAIQRIVLRLGTKVIHDIDYVGYVSARRECEKSLERRSGREMFRYGSNPYWVYNSDGELEPSSTEYKNMDGDNDPSGFRMYISDDADQPTQICVPLSQLLPIFRNALASFPLYALKNEYQMNLEVFWADPEEFCIVASIDAGINGDPEAMPDITISSPQLVLNYVTYPDNITALYDKQISSKEGYVVYYTDTIHTESHIPASTVSNTTMHRIQMSGHELQKLNVSVRQNHRSRWYARACSKDMPSKKFNIRINDSPIFSEDVENQGWQYWLWQNSSDTQRLYLKNGQFSTQLNKVQSENVVQDNGLGHSYDLQGNLNWIVVDFRKDQRNPISFGNGVRVGLNPIEFQLSYAYDATADPRSNSHYQLHFHSEISRILQIQGGNVDVSF